MSDEPSWIVLMTDRYPGGDQPARVCVMAWNHAGRPFPSLHLDRARHFSREDAEYEADRGFPGWCCTAVPTGPGVPALAWEETR